VILTGISACQKASNSDNAAADVFIITFLNQGEPFFQLAHQVQGTDAMKSVTVQTPEGEIDSLKSYDTSYLSYHLESADSSSVPPTPGTYNYTVKFNDGIIKTFTNDLGTSYLTPPVILSLAKSTSSNSIALTWTTVTNAHAYAVVVTSSTGKLAYSTPAYIDPSQTEFDVPTTYFSSPGTYKFELRAYLFEATPPAIQAISKSSMSIAL